MGRCSAPTEQTQSKLRRERRDSSKRKQGSSLTQLQHRCRKHILAIPNTSWELDAPGHGSKTQFSGHNSQDTIPEYNSYTQFQVANSNTQFSKHNARDTIPRRNSQDTIPGQNLWTQFSGHDSKTQFQKTSPKTYILGHNSQD